MYFFLLSVTEFCTHNSLLSVDKVLLKGCEVNRFEARINTMKTTNICKWG